MKKVIIILSLMLPFASWTQIEEPEDIEEEFEYEEEKFEAKRCDTRTIGERPPPPKFPGGHAALLKFVQENFNLPVVAKELDEQGTVWLKFWVSETGKVDSVRIGRGVSMSIDTEAVRVVESMPNWIPGVNFRGEPEGMWINLPIRVYTSGGNRQKIRYPYYEDGMLALQAYIKNELVKTNADLSELETEPVKVSFSIDLSGRPINIKIEEGANIDLNNKIVKIIKVMPDWSPAEKEGKQIMMKTMLIIPG